MLRCGEMIMREKSLNSSYGAHDSYIYRQNRVAKQMTDNGASALSQSLHSGGLRLGTDSPDSPVG